MRQEDNQVLETQVATIPELIKPGRDYYTQNFACLLVLFFYILFFHKVMVQKDLNLIENTQNTTQFSTDLIVILSILILLIVLDRVIYKMRSINKFTAKHLQIEDSIISNLLSKNKEEYEEDWFENYTAIYKLCMHLAFLLFIHVYLCFAIPRDTRQPFFASNHLVLCYLIACFYLYYSALQLKHGYPLASVGQVFTQSTSMLHTISFKSNF